MNNSAKIIQRWYKKLPKCKYCWGRLKVWNNVCVECQHDRQESCLSCELGTVHCW